MSGETDRREDKQVTQFYGRIDEKIAELETDVRLWQVEFKVEDRDRLGPRLYRRGLHGQPKIIVKTKLGTQDVAQFTVDNIIKCLKDNGYGELLEELGPESSDNYFDMRQGKAENIRGFSVKKFSLLLCRRTQPLISMKKFEDIGWRERRFSRNEKFLESRSSQGQTQFAQVRKVITQTIVAKKREEVRDDLREAGDRARDRLGGCAEAPNFHLHGSGDDDQWYELDGQEQEALISLRMHERNFNIRQNRDDSTRKVEAVQGAQENPSMS